MFIRLGPFDNSLKGFTLSVSELTKGGSVFSFKLSGFTFQSTLNIHISQL